MTPTDRRQASLQPGLALMISLLRRTVSSLIRRCASSRRRLGGDLGNELVHGLGAPETRFTLIFQAKFPSPGRRWRQPTSEKCPSFSICSGEQGLLSACVP